MSRLFVVSPGSVCGDALAGVEVGASVGGAKGVARPDFFGRDDTSISLGLGFIRKIRLRSSRTSHARITWARSRALVLGFRASFRAMSCM